MAWVVQKVDNSIHRINHYPVDSVVGLSMLIQWIVIYLVDIVIQLGLRFRFHQSFFLLIGFMVYL